jgi:hypothetical protein
MSESRREVQGLRQSHSRALREDLLQVQSGLREPFERNRLARRLAGVRAVGTDFRLGAFRSERLTARGVGHRSRTLKMKRAPRTPTGSK